MIEFVVGLMVGAIFSAIFMKSLDKYFSVGFPWNQAEEDFIADLKEKLHFGVIRAEEAVDKLKEFYNKKA